MSRRTRIWRRLGAGLLASLLLLALGWGAAGCGVKGNPRPPRQPLIPGL